MDLHDRAAYRQHPGREVQVTHPQLGQLAPAQAALYRGLYQSLDCASGRHSYKAANCSGVMIVRGWAGTGGVLTPLHGCRNVTWSLAPW